MKNQKINKTVYILAKVGFISSIIGGIPLAGVMFLLISGISYTILN